MKTVSELLSAAPEYSDRGWEGFADVYAHVVDPCAGDATLVSDSVSTLIACICSVSWCFEPSQPPRITSGLRLRVYSMRQYKALQYSEELQQHNVA